jgi:hypothetical protein
LQPQEIGMHCVDCSTRVQTEPIGHGSAFDPNELSVHSEYVQAEFPLRVHASGAGAAGVGGMVGPWLAPHSTASVKLPVDALLYPSTLTRYVPGASDWVMPEARFADAPPPVHRGYMSSLVATVVNRYEFETVSICCW